MKISELFEGRHDPHIFKAFYVAGIPGAGKSTVLKMLGLHKMGMRLVDMDQVFVLKMKKKGLSLYMPDSEKKERDEVRSASRVISDKQRDTYKSNYLGLILDGTGRDASYILNGRRELEKLGYSVALIYVNSPLSDALNRNSERAERRVPDHVVKNINLEVKQAIPTLRQAFGIDFIEIPYTLNMDDYEIKEEINKASKKIQQFLDEPISNIAKKILAEK